MFVPVMAEVCAVKRLPILLRPGFTRRLPWICISLASALAAACAASMPEEVAPGPVEPTPSGTILFDTRSWLPGIKTIQELKARFDDATEYNGAWAIDTVHHRMRIDWQARAFSQGESQVTFYKHIAAAGPFCVTWTFETGTPWGLTTGPNAHIKHMLFYRGASDRIYLAWRAGYYVFSIDDRNWDSKRLDFSKTGEPLKLTGQSQHWTVCVTPASSSTASDGAIRAWFRGVKVLDQSGAPIGSTPLQQLQFPATFLTPEYTQSDYWSDIVVWQP